MRLFLLHLAFLEPLGVPMQGYLIQTDDGQNILVDTGFPHGFIAHLPGLIGPLVLQVQMHPEDHVVSRLTSVGLRPEDVHLIVCTHFGGAQQVPSPPD